GWHHCLRNGLPIECPGPGNRLACTDGHAELGECQTESLGRFALRGFAKTVLSLAQFFAAEPQEQADFLPGKGKSAPGPSGNALWGAAKNGKRRSARSRPRPAVADE